MDFKSIVYPILPAPIRIQGRSYLKNVLLDLWEKLTGTADSEIPPHRLNISGNGPFRLLGDNNLHLCGSIGQLKPEDSVLDIGCGIGRTALAMAKFLTSKGSYTGLDVIKFAVEWCQRHVAGMHPNFSFVYADIQNETYNRRGKIIPHLYDFPFENETFTFSLATSLFTHLLPLTAERYIKEAERVLRPGGRFLSTWFLLDERTEAGLASGNALLQFPFRFEVHAQNTLYAPEQAVAFRRSCVEEMLLRNGFIIETLAYGRWSGGASTIDSAQDVVLVRKV
jgi:SAM-dependent methyltransferase